MNFYAADREEGRLTIRRTLAGRLVDAGLRFVTWSPVAMGGLMILFMPDYVCRFREQDAPPGLFWAVLGVCALFIAAIGAFVRFSRRDTWIFDAERGEIRFEANPMVGRSAQTSAELADWSSVDGHPAGWGRESMIGIRFEGRRDEVLCHSRFGWPPIEEVFEAFESFVRDRDLDVEVNRTA